MTPMTVQSMYIFHEVDSFVKNSLNRIKGHETFTKDILSWATDELRSVYDSIFQIRKPAFKI